MAKLTQPTVKIVMIKTRTNKNDDHPLAVRVQWNGRCEKFTGIYLKEINWNSQSQRVVKMSDKVFQKSLNYRVAELLNNYSLKVKSLIDSGLPFSAKDVLKDDNRVKTVEDADYQSVMNMYINNRHLSLSTCRLHRSTYKKLSGYCKSKVIVIEDLDDAFFRGYAKWMGEQGLADSSINQNLRLVAAVLHYAIDEGIVSSEYRYPFNKFKFWNKYEHKSNKRGASEKLIRAMIDDCVLAYRENPDIFKEVLKNKHSELFAQVLCLLSYHLQGLALCDLARIRLSDIELRRINYDDFYVISGLKRKKTNVDIGYIVALKNELVSIIIDSLSSGRQSGYLVGCMLRDDMSEAQVGYCVSDVSKFISINIKKVAVRLGFVDEADDLTYYSFRHSFATSYLLAGGNPVNLATMMGRSVSGIFRYVDTLSGLENIVAEKKKIKLMNGDVDELIESWHNTL